MKSSTLQTVTIMALAVNALCLARILYNINHNKILIAHAACSLIIIIVQLLSIRESRYLPN